MSFIFFSLFFFSPFSLSLQGEEKQHKKANKHTPVKPSKYQGLNPRPRAHFVVPPVKTSSLCHDIVLQSLSSTNPPVSSESGFQAHQKIERYGVRVAEAASPVCF